MQNWFDRKQGGVWAPGCVDHVFGGELGVGGNLCVAHSFHLLFGFHHLLCFQIQDLPLISKPPLLSSSLSLNVSSLSLTFCGGLSLLCERIHPSDQKQGNCLGEN